MNTPIPVSAHVSVFRGTQYIELTSGADYVKLLDDGRDLPDSIARGDSPKGPWVRIEKSDLDRRYRRVVRATWDGQEVHITGTGDGFAYIYFSGSPEWATEHELSGSQYEAWSGSAPIAELTDIRVTEKDIS
jgi:hypothetical protein